MNADTWLIAATVVIALSTAAAATAAFLAARATRRTTEAQLFSQLMSEYASPEMGKALRHLREAHRGWANDPQNRPLEQLVDAWAKKQASSGASGDPLDSARRLVAHFFQKATRIIDEELVRGGLRDELLSLNGTELVHDIVIPLERALAKYLETEAGAKQFIQRFQQVFPDRRARPALAAPAEMKSFERPDTPPDRR
jgi:hypothetical protein